MFMTKNTVSILDYIFKKYPSKINMFDQYKLDYILPSIKKRKYNSFNRMKCYKDDVNNIKYYTKLFLDSDLKNYEYFDKLLDIKFWGFTEIHTEVQFKNKNDALPKAFTFCFNFLNLYHYLHRDLKIIAGIASNPQRYKGLLTNEEIVTWPRYNTIYFLHSQLLYENCVFSHTDEDIPHGYSLQFGTEDIPLINWMIKNSKLRQKQINTH